jgi:[protein-PII] uridylyltransferase
LNTYKNFLIERREAVFVQQRQLSALAKTALFSADMDKLLSSAYTSRLEESEINRHVCLVALGGYGRGELCPYSDIDVLILHSGDADAVAEKIATAVRFFWDMGLTLGLVVRSLHECSRIMGEDVASDTAMLQARFLAGNKRLFQHLESAVIRPYFSKNGKQFVDRMRGTLRNGIFSSDNTLYRTEPNIKDGICGLRDCQRVMWAERVIAGAREISDLYHLSHYKQADIDSFAAAYDFLVNIRIELHTVCKRRIDILETGLQTDVAEALGFGHDNPARVMEAYFRTVRSVKHFVMTFLEKRLPSAGIWTSLRSSIGALKIKQGVSMLDGILFLASRNLPQEAKQPLWILDIFKQALAYNATLSVELSNWIRGTMQSLTPQDFRTAETDALFLDILSQEKGVGRVLSFMHEAGVLAGIIPAFGPLTCKVEYDTNHEYTVDQHILLSLAALDELNTDEDKALRALYARIVDRRLLRIALLLHDIGKSMPGDHVANGAIIAEEMCDRLGLSEAEKRRVIFLVYNHLTLSGLAFGRELEDHLVAAFAQQVENSETLEMLYLLTILDIRNVGYRTWTAWRATLLENAYKRTALFLSRKNAPAADLTSDIGINSALYMRDTLPEDRKKHAQWLSGLQKGKFEIDLETFIGFERLNILTSDRIGLFADITGCISSEGYNILSARAYSMPAGGILDIFNVEKDGVTSIPSERRIANIRKKWAAITAGQATAAGLIDEWLRMYPPKKTRALEKQPSVRFENGISPAFTVLEIEAQDRMGLLYRMARCLSDLGVNIVSARLSTRIDRAIDTFYVTDRQAGKIDDPALLVSISETLTSVLSAE